VWIYAPEFFLCLFLFQNLLLACGSTASIISIHMKIFQWHVFRLFRSFGQTYCFMFLFTVPCVLYVLCILFMEHFAVLHKQICGYRSIALSNVKFDENGRQKIEHNKYIANCHMLNILVSYFMNQVSSKVPDKRKIAACHCRCQ